MRACVRACVRAGRRVCGLELVVISSKKIYLICKSHVADRSVSHRNSGIEVVLDFSRDNHQVYVAKNSRHQATLTDSNSGSEGLPYLVVAIDRTAAGVVMQCTTDLSGAFCDA